MRSIEYNYPEDKYRADPCESVSLSQSIAKILVSESELHAYLEHPRLGGHVRKSTKAMDVGTICHALMLGKPLPEIEHIPFDDYRTNAAKAQRDAAIAAGKIPLKNSEFGEQGKIWKGAEIIREKLRDMGYLFDPAQSEVAMFWSKNGCQCKARFDNLDVRKALDLKFVDSAHPDTIDRQVHTMGYVIQHAAYTEAINELIPEADGQAEFELLFCEIHEPYCVTPAKLLPNAEMIGRIKWKYAQQRWVECLQTNVWREYMAPGAVHMVDARDWEVERAIERFGSGASVEKGDGFL